MIKTIDTNEITEKMFQAFRDNYVDATRCIFAVLAAATAVEPAQRCNCCGYLVTDSEHKGCLRAAKQEPAQAVPVGYCLMPREPTQWMREQIACGIESNSVADVWGRLIRAVDIENKHRAKEPAQAVPAFWANENILKDSLRDNISCILTTTKCAANTVPLYTAPPAIDDETRHRLILVCEYLETVGLMFVSPRVISSQIRAILEAGNEN